MKNEKFEYIEDDGRLPLQLPFAYVGAFFDGETLELFLREKFGDDYSGTVSEMMEAYIATHYFSDTDPNILVMDARKFQMNNLPGWFIGTNIEFVNPATSIKRLCIDVRRILTSMKLMEPDEVPGTVDLIVDIINLD